MLQKSPMIEVAHSYTNRQRFTLTTLEDTSQMLFWVSWHPMGDWRSVDRSG